MMSQITDKTNPLNPGTDNNQPLDVKQILMIMTQQIALLAWQKMGLQPDAVTGKIHKDLNQAKLAIDSVHKLSEAYEATLNDEERTLLQNILKDLKLNFVGLQNHQ